LVFLFRLCNLPVSEDTDEAPFVYGYLCKLIESHHPLVLGANNSNIPSLTRIIAEAFLRDAIDRSHAVAQRMIMIVKQIQVIKNITRLYQKELVWAFFINYSGLYGYMVWLTMYLYALWYCQPSGVVHKSMKIGDSDASTSDVARSKNYCEILLKVWFKPLGPYLPEN